MKNNEVDKIDRTVFIVILGAIAIVALIAFGAFTLLVQTTEVVEQHTGYTYEEERVDFALAEAFIHSQFSSTTNVEISHSSKNNDSFYFQGETAEGLFMFILNKTASGTFEVVSGISDFTSNVGVSAAIE